MNKSLKYFLIIAPISIIALISFLIFLYLTVLPNFVKSSFVYKNLSKIVNEMTSLDLKIENPNLKTSLKPTIDFNVDKLLLEKNEKVLINLEDFKISFSFDKIFQKEIKLNHLLSKTLIVKADELLEQLQLKEQEAKEEQEFDWKIDFYDSNIKLDKFFLSYNQKNNTKFEMDVKDIVLNCEKDYKALAFDFDGLISGDNKEFAKIKTKSKDEVKIYDDSVKINNLDVLVNDSDVKITSKIDFENVFINAKSDKFYLTDVFDLVNSNFIIPNGSDLLLPLNSPKGNVKFDVNLNNDVINGYITTAGTKAKIKDLSNIPININKGKILITKDKIDFVDLAGYYGKSKKNTIEINGDIKDYYKTFDSNIVISTVVTNEFLKDYLAKLINNTVITLSKPTKTKIIYKAKNNIMDISWLAGVPKGVEFAINNSTPTLTDYTRAVKGDFHIEGNSLDIKNINYYIASDAARGVKLNPILILDGKMYLDGTIDNIGFKFNRKMPCEFLNIFTNEKTFKKGTIEGRLNVAFKNNIPVLDADMQIEKTILPNARLFVKNATLKTENNLIKVAMDGGFKRIKYDFKGSIKNELEPPFVIKNMTLNLDNLDVEKFLLSLNNQQTVSQNTDKIESEEDIQDDEYMFDTNLIRIEDSEFSLNKGNYKDLTFSDIKARMTLDEKGILKIQSNKFNIAQGISTLKVESDLKNLTHYIRLGVKDVDSDLMARVILNLDKEISGKAKGLIELNTDKDMKLNGKISFAIDDGTIGKIGLVEYLLKIASVFRNPVVMMSPSVVMDIINIPEGKFDKIKGTIDLKDNVATRINIQSTAPTLSALIRGKFDMERHDASLRIYTRFSTDKKSMFGFLRNLSLNALANKVQMNSKNDLNYYSSELVDLPQIEVGEEKSQIFLVQVEGDVEHNNYLSSLKKIK